LQAAQGLTTGGGGGGVAAKGGVRFGEDFEGEGKVVGEE